MLSPRAGHVHFLHTHVHARAPLSDARACTCAEGGVGGGVRALGPPPRGGGSRGELRQPLAGFGAEPQENAPNLALTWSDLSLEN